MYLFSVPPYTQQIYTYLQCISFQYPPYAMYIKSYNYFPFNPYSVYFYGKMEKVSGGSGGKRELRRILIWRSLAFEVTFETLGQILQWMLNGRVLDLSQVYVIQDISTKQVGSAISWYASEASPCVCAITRPPQELEYGARSAPEILVY